MKVSTLLFLSLLLGACASPEKSRQQLFLEADRLSGGATTHGGDLELNVLEIPSHGPMGDLLEISAIKLRGRPEVRRNLQQVEASEDPRILLISKAPALEQAAIASATSGQSLPRLVFIYAADAGEQPPMRAHIEAAGGRFIELLPR